MIDGDSLNIVGLDGSGRSTELHNIIDELDSDWLVLHWRLSDLHRMRRTEVNYHLDNLSHPDKIPVLFIDDFGAFLVTDDGLWLDQLLFFRVNQVYPDDRWSLRCVIVTHPRDNEIVTDGSCIRDRAKLVHSPHRPISEHQMSRFGCATDEEMLLLTGCNNHLLQVGGINPNQRRGNLKTTAHKLLPRWVGQLRVRQQNRISMILRGKTLWDEEDSDALLSPLVVPKAAHSPVRCSIVSCIEKASLGELLVGAPWPDRDLSAAARRFCARCGNDPTPLWADSFLSDQDSLDFKQLIHFLGMIASNSGHLSSLRILSSNAVAGQPINPQRIASQLANLPDELVPRLEWRLHPRSVRSSHLHQRQLVLEKRRDAFSLPPATTVIGQRGAGNETDAAIDFNASRRTLDAWSKGIHVFP
ncbi:MAG: hypothetical protein F4144_11450 [Acidimicrobiaceae bacterium]|nr:hypothetical protein [Acidimicrobiaceae bacterium]